MKRKLGVLGLSMVIFGLVEGTASADNILIWTGGQDHDGTNNVVTVLGGLGHTLTVTATVPADLSSFDSLWAMDYWDGPDAPNERAMVKTFLDSDRGVYAQFEWDGCCTSSQINWTATLVPLLKDPFLISGSLESSPAQAESGEVFGLHTAPNAMPFLETSATAIIATIPAANVVYRLEGQPIVGAYVDPQFVSGKGAIVLSGDIEELFISESSNQWIQNIQYFLKAAAPNPPAICGDGFLAQAEGCDDGNTTSGDGCSSACAVESGYACTNNTSNTPVSNCQASCAGSGNACSAGVGACHQTGVIVCDGGGNPVCGAVAGQPAAEQCDGIDNDCDGTTDEGFNLGAACNVGVGACAASGVIACAPNKTAACNATAGQPAAELCDGIDNDCDGSTDEGLNLGAACSVGVGACQSAGVIACAPNKTATCSATAGQPSAELCDGVDNDCDGSTDEGFNLGAACSMGAGACEASGVMVCAPNKTAVCNAVTGQPTAELCDGLDNDCDDSTDEGFNLGAACNVGVGACAASGVIACAANGTAACNATAGQPSAELCDGIDNDCDGSTDEGLNLGAACSVGVGACQAAGVIACAPNKTATCNATAGQPASEVCDGIDNDCDGSTDEGFNLGAACSVGVGACQSAGVIACTANGTAACNATAGQPASEVCDGIDNNCDGSTDEGFNLGAACSVGVGACQSAGVIACTANGTAACNATAGQPVAEQCDGVDNNCDGSTDEGFNLGAACSVGVGACQSAGVIACTANGTAGVQRDRGPARGRAVRRRRQRL